MPIASVSHSTAPPAAKKANGPLSIGAVHLFPYKRELKRVSLFGLVRASPRAHGLARADITPKAVITDPSPLFCAASGGE